MVRLDIHDRRRRAVLSFPVLVFWVFQVALPSTSSAFGGHAITWQESLQKSIIAWTVWARLATRVDPRLSFGSSGNVIRRW
jgi:hypothetical protein